MSRLNKIILALVVLAGAIATAAYVHFVRADLEPPMLSVISQSAWDGSSVTSTWDIVATDPTGNPLPDPCSTTTCTGSAPVQYWNLSFGTYQLVAPTPPPGYAFFAYLATRGSSWVLDSKETFSNANLLGWLAVQWDPLPTFDVSTTTIDLSNTQSNSSFTITDNGPNGASLNWATNVAYIGNPPSNWLNLSQASSGANPIPLLPASTPASQVIGVSADGTGLSPGTYKATITFSGSANPDNQSIPIPPPITVTFVNSASMVCPGDPACPVCPTFFANPTIVTPPQASGLSYSCKNVNSCTVSGGQFGIGQPITVQGTSANGTVNANPSADTTYVLSCIGGTALDPQYSLPVSAHVGVTQPGVKEIVPQ